MNSVDPLQGRYALVREMLEVPDYVRALDVGRIAAFADRVKGEPILLTGEGSSRIFPAKKTMADGLRWRYRERLVTDGATQALEYDLRESFVFIASNSGKTKEGVRLLRHLICYRAHARCDIREDLLAGREIPEDAHPNRPLAKWLV